MKNNIDITKPRYSEQILSVPWLLDRGSTVAETSRDSFIQFSFC